MIMIPINQSINELRAGMLNPIPIIDEIVKTVYNYSEELIECHAPKPILLPTGEVCSV